MPLRSSADWADIVTGLEQKLDDANARADAYKAALEEHRDWLRGALAETINSLCLGAEDIGISVQTEIAELDRELKA